MRKNAFPLFSGSPSPQGKGLCCLLLAGLLGCSGRHLAVIEGTLPGGSRYDGETVYLVPVEKATADNVDSTCIRRGAFRFERILGDEPEGVCIIRTRPLLRRALEELLVIPEPGRLQVTLDSVSSAHGTPLNEALQQWKERKQQYDAQRHSRKKAGEEYADYTCQFILRNRENAAGRFVYGLSKHILTPEQRQALRMPD
jgi:hypothetical protein